MTESAPPSRHEADGGRDVATPTGSRAFRRTLMHVLAIIDGLRTDIDAVWNEAPETLAKLVEWDDVLAVQGRELVANHPEASGRALPLGGLVRVGRSVARDIAGAFASSTSPARLIATGRRLCAAQSAAVAAADEPAMRDLIERHRKETESRVERLQAHIDARP